jgi:hypothetical protein
MIALLEASVLLLAKEDGTEKEKKRRREGGRFMVCSFRMRAAATVGFD